MSIAEYLYGDMIFISAKVRDPRGKMKWVGGKAVELSTNGNTPMSPIYIGRSPVVEKGDGLVPTRGGYCKRTVNPR